jgi:hypothetical protein
MHPTVNPFMVATEAPRGMDAWHLVGDSMFDRADLGILLWGRAHRLRNRLNIAKTRDDALQAAIDYLVSMRALVAMPAFGDETAPAVVRWLRDCTDAAFTTEAIAGARIAAVSDDTDGTAPV